MLTIYHNPRCSKSRQTLALLRERGDTPKIIDYLQTPPGEGELRDLISMLGIGASDLIRRGESLFQELGLECASEEALIAAMAANPILIERPIVVAGDRAALGRPPEAVLTLFD